MLLGANNLFTAVNPAERAAGDKAGIEYHRFSYHDAMTELQHLGRNDEAEMGEIFYLFELPQSYSALYY